MPCCVVALRAALAGLCLWALPAAGLAAGHGQAVFASTCAGCHGGDAEGVPGSYPRLRGRVSAIAQTPVGRRYLISAVSYGLFGNITVDDQPIMGVMPPHPQLGDDDVAAVLNYLAGLDAKDGADKSPFTSAQVGEVRSSPRTGSQVHKLRPRALKAVSAPSDGSDEAADASADAAAAHARLGRLRRAVAGYRTKARNTFQLNCAGCHGFKGESPTGGVPTLKNTVGYFPHLKRGRAFLGRVPGVSMSMLDDTQTAQVLNWLLLTFSADQLPTGFRPYTAPEVHALREKPLTTQSDRMRAQILANLRERGVVTD